MLETEIDALSGAEFTTGEISRVKRICIDQDYATIAILLDRILTLRAEPVSPATVGVPLDDDDQSERKVMRSHLLVWYNEFLDGTIAVKGGKRGTDFDNVRDKEDLRREVRRMLGLPLVSPEVLALEDRLRFGPKRVSQSVDIKRQY